MDYSDQVKRTEAGGPELDPTTTAQVVELEEVDTNHLSPMGQVEDIGRFIRGVGTSRLRRLFQIGLTLVMAGALAAIVVRAVS